MSRWRFAIIIFSCYFALLLVGRWVKCGYNRSDLLFLSFLLACVIFSSFKCEIDNSNTMGWTSSSSCIVSATTTTECCRVSESSRIELQIQINFVVRVRDWIMVCEILQRKMRARTIVLPMVCWWPSKDEIILIMNPSWIFLLKITLIKPILTFTYLHDIHITCAVRTST